jgi:hypothetical protein
MSEVISRTTVMIGRNTPITVQKLPGGEIEVTFGVGGVCDPEVGTSASLIITDPLTTIPEVQAALQSGFVEAHHCEPAGEQAVPNRKDSTESPGGTARRHLRGL